jgi:ferrous iron transport protein A
MVNANALSSLPAARITDRTPELDQPRLATTSPGQKVRILRIAQDEEFAAWLRAVGMHENAEVTVLRRAPFGGPIHLRSHDGGEFAIHRDLARCIHVTNVEPRGSTA